MLKNTNRIKAKNKNLLLEGDHQVSQEDLVMLAQLQLIIAGEGNFDKMLCFHLKKYSCVLLTLSVPVLLSSHLKLFMIT